MLEGLVAPEDLGLSDFTTSRIRSASTILTHMNKNVSQLPHDVNSRLKRPNEEDRNKLAACTKVT